MGTMDYDVFQKRYKLYTPPNYPHANANNVMDSIPQQINRIYANANANVMDSIPEQTHWNYPNANVNEMDSIPE